MLMTKDRVRDQAQILINLLGKLTLKQRKEPIERHTPHVARLNMIIGWAKQVAPDVEWPQPFSIQEDAGSGIPVVSGSIAELEFAAQEILSLLSEIKSADKPVAGAAAPAEVPGKPSPPASEQPAEAIAYSEAEKPGELVKIPAGGSDRMSILVGNDAGERIFVKDDGSVVTG